MYVKMGPWDLQIVGLGSHVVIGPVVRHTEVGFVVVGVLLVVGILLVVGVLLVVAALLVVGVLLIVGDLLVDKEVEEVAGAGQDGPAVLGRPFSPAAIGITFDPVASTMAGARDIYLLSRS